MPSEEIIKKLYSEKALINYYHPQNQGAMNNPTVVGKIVGNDCGDETILYLKINNEKIVDAKFETNGCVAAISSLSVLTEMIKNEEINNVLNISQDDIIEKLNGLPDFKKHCSLHGLNALKKSIENYRDFK